METAQNEVNNETISINRFEADFKTKTVFLKKVFKLLSCTNNETKLVFDKNGISTKLVDYANVEMSIVKIPKECFEEYFVNQNGVIGIDIDKMYFILKTTGKNDYVNFRYNDETYKVDLNIGLFKQTMGSIDTEGMPDFKIPNLELPSQFVVDTNIFLNFLIQANNISDHVSISCNKEGVTFFAEGDIDKINVFIEKQLLEKLVCFASYKSLFSSDYLLTIVRQLKPLYSKLEINIGNDNPISIVGRDKHETTVLLAPRIEED